MSYLKFIMQPKSELDICIILNNEDIPLGRLEKTRVGAWMSWCLFLNQDCYLSASCQDEVRDMTKRLNAKNSSQNLKISTEFGGSL